MARVILGYNFSVGSKLSSSENIVFGVFLCLCGKGGKPDDPEAGTCFPRRQAVAAAADLNTRCCRLASFLHTLLDIRGEPVFSGLPSISRRLVTRELWGLVGGVSKSSSRIGLNANTFKGLQPACKVSALLFMFFDASLTKPIWVNNGFALLVISFPVEA